MFFYFSLSYLLDACRSLISSVDRLPLNRCPCTIAEILLTKINLNIINVEFPIISILSILRSFIGSCHQHIVILNPVFLSPERYFGCWSEYGVNDGIWSWENPWKECKYLKYVCTPYNKLMHRFEQVECIGTGAYSTVFKGIDIGSRETVAIKQISHKKTGMSQVLNR